MNELHSPKKRDQESGNMSHEDIDIKKENIFYEKINKTKQKDIIY